MRIFLFLILVSCGSRQEQASQCYTGKEAIDYCTVKESIEKQWSTEYARMYCSGFYSLDDYCYQLY